MKNLLRLVCLSLAAFTASSVSYAQATPPIHIRFLSTFAQPGQAIPQECIAARDVLLANLKVYPHPDDWTYIIACDERAWDRVLLAVDEVQTNTRQYYGFTNRDDSMTYFRGPTLVRMNDDRATPEHVIAHELCHIFLRSGDENKVDRLASKWVADHAAAASRTLTVATNSPSSGGN